MIAPRYVDPATLSSQQRRALVTIAAGRCQRRRGGWGWPPKAVSLDVAQSLVGLALVRKVCGVGEPVLELTALGRDVRDIMKQRLERKRA